MSDDSPKSVERAIAQQTQEKFRLYLLSLVFTLLALSVQTAKFGTSNFADGCEIVGWLSLLLSGFAGLSHLEWTPNVRVKLATRSDLQEEIYKLKTLLLQGQRELHVLDSDSRQAIPDRIQNRENAVTILDPHIASLERWSDVKYDLHKYGFALGITLVALSRAFEPSVVVLRALHVL